MSRDGLGLRRAVTARRAGVLGRPIQQSLSPVLHRAAYAALALDWSYDAVDCGVPELPRVLSERAGWAGFSATMPLKHAVLDVAGEISPIAAAVGAANTLLPGPNGWRAGNTDVRGILDAVRAGTQTPRSATVVGAGGTAQAVLAAFSRLGLAACTMLVREPRRAAPAVETAHRVGIAVAVERVDPQASALAADLVVSALPPGAADPLGTRAWQPSQTVLDVVYAGWPTPLASTAAAAGATVISGATMLLYQAAAQVELMTGRAAPVAAMRAALLDAAPGCGA